MFWCWFCFCLLIFTFPLLPLFLCVEGLEFTFAPSASFAVKSSVSHPCPACSSFPLEDIPSPLSWHWLLRSTPLHPAPQMRNVISVTSRRSPPHQWKAVVMVLRASRAPRN